MICFDRLFILAEFIQATIGGVNRFCLAFLKQLIG